MGGPLFVRTSRRVELTEAGELLLPEARRALAQADRALHVARQPVHGRQERYASASRASRPCRASSPTIYGTSTARSQESTSPDRASRLPLRSREFAMAHSTSDTAPDLGLKDAKGLRVSRRGPTPMSVALRSDHELASAAVVTTADLADHDLIVFASEDEGETILSRLWPAVAEGRAPGPAGRQHPRRPRAGVRGHGGGPRPHRHRAHRLAGSRVPTTSRLTDGTGSDGAQPGGEKHRARSVLTSAPSPAS